MTVNESPQLQEIKQRYRLSLSDKADFLSNWTDSTAHTQIEFIELAAWLHRFAGSAGMYGYDDLAQAARALMMETESVLEQNETSDGDFCYQTHAKQMKVELSRLGKMMRDSVLE